MPPRRAPARGASGPKGKAKAVPSTATTSATTIRAASSTTAPTQSTAPTQPTTPTQPTASTQPTEPTAPTQPTTSSTSTRSAPIRPPPVGESLFLPGGEDNAPSDEDDYEVPNPTANTTATTSKPTRADSPIDNASEPELAPEEGDDFPSDSDDDPIVHTYDIHVTTTLSPHLYLFQYPVRGSHLPFANSTGSCPISARIKPDSGAVELDIPINTTRHYDQEKGRKWGEALRKARLDREARASTTSSRAAASGKRRRIGNEDGSDDDADSPSHLTFEEARASGRILATQTLGGKIQADNTRYMIGVFRNNQLHLTPLKATVQLRPQFHHIDTATELERVMNRSLRIDPNNPTGNPNTPAAARALQATVKTTDDGGGGGMGDVLKVLRKEEGEGWKTMSWVDQDEGEAWEIFDSMFLPGTEEKGTRGAAGGTESAVDADGDVPMEGPEGKGDLRAKAKAKVKTEKDAVSGRGITKLKTTITGAEYLHMFAAPRVERE